jgi:hypothetical protein
MFRRRSVLDGDLVVDGGDPGRQPRLTLGFLLLRDSADGSLQRDLRPRHLNRNSLRIE